MRTYINSSGLSRGDRLPGRDRQFFDDYRDQSLEDIAELHLAYGDEVVILKKLKTPHRDIDLTGKARQTGRFGSQRHSIATGTQPVPTEFGRPEEVDKRYEEITCPALVNLDGDTRKQDGGGPGIFTQPDIVFSIKILEDRGITIDKVEDLFFYHGTKYRTRRSFPRVNYLGMKAELVFEVEET